MSVAGRACAEETGFVVDLKVSGGEARLVLDGELDLATGPMFFAARHARRVEAARAVAHIAAGAPDALTETISRDEVDRLRAAIAQLPPAQMRVVLLAYGGGLTNEQVAQRTGVPIGTVKGRLRLGGRNIARLLAPGRRVEAPIAG